MAKLLVTGASGYLGHVLCAHAAEAGLEVVGTHHRHEPAGLRSVPLDVRDRDAVAGLLVEEAPDHVIHTAYLQDGEAARAINVDGAVHVAAAAGAVGARLVHLSSDVVFAGDGDRPLREDDAPAPVTAYGTTKAVAETGVLAAHPDALVVRTSLIYGGPGADASKHEELALAAARGERDIAFFTDELRCPVQVDDLADALLEFLTLTVAGPLHVAGADPVSRLEFAQLVATAAGEDAEHLTGRPAPPGRPRNCALDCGLARALLRTRLRGVRSVLG